MDADVDLEGSVITGVSAYLETCTISKFPALMSARFFSQVSPTKNGRLWPFYLREVDT